MICLNEYKTSSHVGTLHLICLNAVKNRHPVESIFVDRSVIKAKIAQNPEILEITNTTVLFSIC